MGKSIGVLRNLPTELDYLIDPALKYGVHQTDDDHFEFLKRATPEEMDELASVAERFRLSEHHDQVADFFDAYPITEHAESAKLYWLFGLMGDAGLPLSPENWDTVERHIDSLRRFGSFRIASERAHAAMLLADFGKDAAQAIPDLRRAVQDEDLRVQVWAHYALAVIEGNCAAHEQAIREIYSRHNKKDPIGCHVDDVGEDAAAALEKLGEKSTTA
jgi:hypothetical protein